MSNLFFKILILCLTTAVFAVVLKPKSSEYAFLITVATGVIIGVTLIKNIAEPIKAIGESFSKYGIESDCFKVALKAVGIGYITSFIADACRDCGQSSLALKAELAGKCAIFLLSAPLLISVLETAVGFIK